MAHETIPGKDSWEEVIPLYETENANHSLETGDVDLDIRNMRKMMKIIKAYAENEEEETC